jgi:hypothetical protein
VTSAEGTSVEGRRPDGVRDSEPWDRRRDRRAALLLFLIVWGVYLGTATYTVSQINDTRATAQSAWSLGTRGTLALPQEWEGTIDWEKEGRDGRLYTNRFPGPILWAAPFYTVGEALFPRETPGHPHLLNYAPAGVAAATAAALAVLASFLLFRRLADRRLAVIAAGVLAFGTGVWSVSADAMWNHGLTHLTLSLGVLAAIDGRHVRSGAAFAAAVITRPQVAVFAAVVGLWKGAVTRQLRPIIVIGAVSALGALAMVIYTRVLFGLSLPVAGHSPERVTDVATVPFLVFAERVWLTFVDPVRGVLFYVPALLVLLPFVRRGWRISPWWVKASAVAGVVYMVVQLRSNTYHGGAQFFGSRLTLEPLVLAAPLFLRTWQAFLSRQRVLRWLLGVLLTIGIALHALGATVWRSPFFDSEAVWEAHFEEICADPDVVGC